MKPFTLAQPGKITEAAKLWKNTSAYIGGGTNLVDLMKKHVAQPDQLIDLQSAQSPLIERAGNGLRIGAGASNSSIADHELVKNNYPLLRLALLAGATPQIRNMATAGGNLLQRTRCPYFYDTSLPCNKRNPGSGCGALNGDQRIAAIIGYSQQCIAVHPSDFCVGLAALDAVVHIQQANGQAGKMPLTAFHRLPGTTPQSDTNLPPGAIISHIEIPASNFAAHSAYVKLRDRDSYAFALISAAAALEMNGEKIVKARLASGGVAHRPWRWTAAEQFLAGKIPSRAVFQQAADLAVAQVKPLQGNKYKSVLLQGAIVQALHQTIQTKNS